MVIATGFLIVIATFIVLMFVPSPSNARSGGKHLRHQRVDFYANNVKEIKDDVVYAPRDVMDASFDRSAGRYCGHCGSHGSHHTDRHNDFARTALKNAGH